MYKLIFQIWIISILFSIVWAWSNKYFEIKSDWYLTWWSTITLDIKDNNLKQANVVKLKIWDIILNYVWKWNNWIYLFKVPTSFKLNISKLHVKIYIDDKEFLWPSWPYFVGIDLTDLRGWGKVKLIWKFTWNCTLMLSNWDAWGISQQNSDYFVSIPSKIDKQINWWYVKCDDLGSNYVRFIIHKSPFIKYIIFKDRKAKVGGVIKIIWYNFKIDNNDEIKIFLWWDDISKNCDIVSSTQILCELPYKNINDQPIKILRNWFESNQVNITVIEKPQIDNITTIYKNWKSYFKIVWNWDYKLWDIKVYYNWNQLNVAKTWKNYILVKFPEVNYWNNKKDFSCSYILKPWYFQVEVWWEKSNKFFVNFKNFPKVKSVEYPFCDNYWCYLKIWVDNPGDRNLKVFINWESKEVYGRLGSSLVRIKTDGLYKKWVVTILNDRCFQSTPYYFDYSFSFMPKIYYVKSSDNFSPYWEVEIVWDKLSYDGATGDIQLNLQFSKDVYDKASIVPWYNSIKFRLGWDVDSWQLIELQVSNRNWISNKWVFKINWYSKYIAYPLIKNVIFPNWAFEGAEAEILWVGFSDKCYEDQIDIGSKIIYPIECSYSKLVFKVPREVFDSLKVIVFSQGIKKESNSYKFLSKRWWFVDDSWEIKIENTFNKKIIDKIWTDTLSFDLKLINHNTDLYFRNIQFLIKTSYSYLPLEDFVLAVNWDDTKYFYDFQNKVVNKLDKKNIWYIEKVKPWVYKLIFKDIYIPFNIDPEDISISFKLSPNISSSGYVDIILPSQNIYYNNIYSDSEKVNVFKVWKDKLVFKLIINPVKKICFDSDEKYSNCSFILQVSEGLKDKKSLHKRVKNDLSNSSNERSKNSLRSTDNQSKSKKQFNSKRFSLCDRIAKKLNKQKMMLIADILYKWTVKTKRKYPLNPYLRKLKVYTILMKKIKTDDYKNKKKFACYILWFVKYFKLFNRSIRK